MQHPLSTPALCALLVAGAAFGVHLGESAVAEIDPVHFSGPAIHPRDRGVAIDPNAVQPAQPRFATLYGWEEGDAARDSDCGGCGAIPARDAYADEPYAYPYAASIDRERAYEDAVAEAEVRASDALDEAERVVASVDWDRVERYASYPITLEEAEAAASDFDDSDLSGGL